MGKDIERFEQWASTYEQSWMQRAFFEPTHRATLALAAGMVQQPASVLDVGCGTGKLLRQARAYWPVVHLIGVDPANGMIEMAKRVHSRAGLQALFKQAGLQVQTQQKVAWRGLLATVGKK